MSKTKSDLAKALQNVQLNKEFWLPKFAKLGVTSVTELQQQEGNIGSLYILQKQIEYEWEKNALRNLLKIDMFGQSAAASAQKHEEPKSNKSRNDKLPQLDSHITPGHCDQNQPRTGKRSLQKDIAVAKQSNSKSEASDHMIPNMSESNPAAYTLFLKLGLTDHYSKKLGLQDALCIRSEPIEMSLNESYPTEPKQLPFVALQKLMSFDCQCRSDLMEASRAAKPRDKLDRIHPVDNLLALIICSDHFLQQDLFSRLAKCQLAVPFILPDPFTKELLLPLWAMRSIKKEWKCIQTDQKVVEHASYIIKYRMPIVSSMRIGKYNKRGASKSIILNGVITESQHFFHRDLPGGNLKHILGDGLVDMSWYLPAGKTRDVFPDAITFLNLHGDARSHPKQSKFLCQISSMLIILLTEENMEFDEHTLKTLKHFSSSGKDIILLQYGPVPESLKKEPIAFTPIDMEELNAAGITVEIQQKICAKIFFSSYKTIEECCSDLTPENGIHVDESIKCFQKALKHANRLTRLVQEPEGESIKCNAKEEMLPLQGKDMWQAWSILNKELNRLEQRGNKDVNEYAAEIETKKKSIRDRQHQLVKALSPLMDGFMTSLLTLEDRTERNFFLQCLILGLNSLSEYRISGLLTQYQATQEEISKLQRTTGTIESKKKTRDLNAEKIDRCRKELTRLKNDIISASFGLHHLLRELGQIYEAALEFSEYSDLSQLPKAAADLLLDGYPLELMDGDAAHVPVKWVKAVISEVEKKLKDPLMFVLSVLGLQSTGKSTLLNTVFGLTFNTSAGRCTRGVFMQLLPVDKTIKVATGYSYVMVIDTEGLRTPELDSLEARKHDNELATFIIGLANATFINVSGEVAGDLDDILQTTVHAFLRMNQVKSDPSCQFIHQNSGASAKSQVGRDNFSKQLDKWTLNAAREESLEGVYEKFSDVIQFDDRNDVYHFPGLWKGDPPMAPVNQGYSQDAQEMKLNFIQKLHGDAKSTRVSSFQRRVSDLWDALLKENFVFSFKNTEEITAYNLLGAKFNKWEGKIQAKMLDWEKKATNEINTEKSIDEIPAVVKKKQNEILEVVQSVYKLQKKEMDSFFEEDKQKGILVQWKRKFEIKLEAVKEEWVVHADNHCVQLGKGRHAISQFKENKIRYTNLIKSNAQKIFDKLKKEQDELDESLEKGKLNKTQLKKIMKNKHKLFVPEKLAKFKQKGIELTEEQCHDLTEEKLEHILIVKLKPEEAKIVLKERLEEEELRAEFEKIWSKLIDNLPPVYTGSDNKVEKKVENKLISYAETFEVKIQLALRSKPLRKWGEMITTDFEVMEATHYTVKKNSTWIGQAVEDFGRAIGWPWTKKKSKHHSIDPHQFEAQKITHELFRIAMNCLEEMKGLKTYFNEGYTLDLLQMLDTAIEEKSSKSVEHFTFTQEYKIEVFLIACGHAVVQFEKMDTEFREQNDPRKYLEKYQKEPLFSKYKHQYYQTAAEEAIADNLCAALRGPIRAQIESSLGAKIVEQMRLQSYLTNKMALKTKILIDLGTQKRFMDYITYLTDIEQSLKEWIEHYTMEYCNERFNDGTHLQTIAKKEVSRMILILKIKVEKVKDKDASKWLSTFCDDMEIRRELGVSLDTINVVPEIETLDLNNFKKQMESELLKLEKMLHRTFNEVMCDVKEMGKWQDRPYNLLKNICGCTEQCPFCGEQCDLAEHSSTNVKHTVAQHRPDCVIGYRDKDTQILVLDICPSQVAGDKLFRNKDTDLKFYPYKKYLDKYPKWHIPPDPAAQDSIYWKWFVGQYFQSLAKHFEAKQPEVPKQWREIQWKDVEANLKSQYNL